MYWKISAFTVAALIVVVIVLSFLDGIAIDVRRRSFTAFRRWTRRNWRPEDLIPVGVRTIELKNPDKSTF